ncbi:MAG: demethylmenaquinone methyltransferase [Dermatophilus congolensis]|nr:demethylmenaquinone methyltransferase [Dermatophilus congolensis]
MTRASLDKQPSDVASMFDDVAPRYDITNLAMSGGMEKYWRRVVLREINARPGDRVLDIAAGTGTSSAILADRGVDVVPADFSIGMLKVGRGRRPDLPFLGADATALPFADESFDAVTISFGIRNVADYDQALREFLRVTKPGGKLVICEFSDPVVPVFRGAYRWYLGTGLPAVARRVSSDPESYLYLAESIKEWPTQPAFAAHVREAGWADVRWRNLTGGIVALHTAVRRALG